jgi:hypothetical protein
MDINAWCGKCKLERTHTITAMDGEKIQKVTCSTCGGTHNYRSKPSAEKKAATGAKTAGTRSTRGSKTASYTINPNAPVRSYSMSSNFSEGDVINHPKFGLGSVLTSLAPNKIEVRFEEGTKILLHNTR